MMTRIRALTHILVVIIARKQQVVEMMLARLRALTHNSIL